METPRINVEALINELRTAGDTMDPKRLMQIVRDVVSVIIGELNKVVNGYDDTKLKILYALFADVHVLLESVPGLAKTLLIESLQAAISESKSDRIQFVADLTPSDIVGSRVFNQGTGKFEDDPGPAIGTNFLLADEINRAPGKTQSSLLSAMQERKVMIGKKAYHLEDPFLVLATMNPIEQEGTYPLPEAQLDRFALKLRLDYVSREDERAMLRNTALEGRGAHSKLVTPSVSIHDIILLREAIRSTVYVSDALIDYVLGLIRSTRPGKEEFKAACVKRPALQELVKVGCSPRALQTLIKLGRVRAACEGRDYVLPEDVRAIAHDVMRHRIILDEAAVWNGDTTDDVIDHVIAAVPIVDNDELYKRR